MYAITTLEGQGTSKSGTYITYISLNPSLNMTAAAWDKRPIDLIGHPCMNEKFHHLIHDEILNEHFRWKFPTYQEDDLNEDGSFNNWIPPIDPADPSNNLFR